MAPTGFQKRSACVGEQVVTDLFLPPNTNPDTAIEIGYEAATCSPYLYAFKPIVVLVSHGYDRRPYVRLRIKAYVFDHRYEPKMMSDITCRVIKEFLRMDLLKGWKMNEADVAPA